MVMSRTDGPTVVVGAGVLGLSAAVHLVRAGVRDVTVLDAGGPLHGTTLAGAGFVGVFAADLNRRLDPVMIDLATYSLDFYRDLDASGADIGYAANGNVVLATSQTTMDAARHGLLGHPRRLPGTREVGPEELAIMTEGVVDPAAVVGGVLMAEGAQVTTGDVCLALLAELAAADVPVLFEHPVDEVQVADGRVTGVRTGAEVVPAGTVVLACGAWTNDLVRPLGWSMPLLPVVATRFVTADLGLPPTMPSFQCLDLGLWLRELGGGFSWGTGLAYRGLAALRREGIDVRPGRPDLRSAVDRQHELQPGVAAVFPRLAGQPPVDVLQGMPTYTADGNFFVGELPTCAGVWTLAGDNESGVTHGPGVGRLLADLVTGSEPVADPTPLRLDRHAPDRYPDDDTVIAELAGDRIAFVFA